MTRYVCIHGHFYQPPRENPWLEDVELQDSAHPYHDWNQRITDECYAPNAAARILDEERRIAKIVDNYSRMSFNFGPTLLQWMETHHPRTHAAIIEADVRSRDRFSGHGSAIAQVYNHVIMPLATREEKITQVRWGIRDFEHRFNRPPEGMWLAETAVDVESLDILAEHGIRFSILAPHQARSFRPPGKKQWTDAPDGSIDPRRAYGLELPSGRRIALFFYDGPTSRAVAFENVLADGEGFARRLLGLLKPDHGPQLAHIATDGETYGHHHRFGDMGLAYALDFIEVKDDVALTNYGEFLERHPPEHEVQIHENTSWSCAHGIERWRSDCGCRGGGDPEWNQAWRKPLREALDFLRDELSRGSLEMERSLLKDPSAARDDYIEVILDRSPENVLAFIDRHAAGDIGEEERVIILKLMEMQRHAMLMYTSCGWFFSELSGIETVQVIQYAARAIQLAQELFGGSLEEPFLQRLEKAKSNIPEHQDGRLIYEKFVRPAMVDLIKVGAHYAVSSLFETDERRDRVYCFDVESADYRTMEAGRARLAVGRAKISSRITRESKTVTHGVFHMGDHNLAGGVRDFGGHEAYDSMVLEVTEAFQRSEVPVMIQLFDKHFGTSTYSLRALFRDEQRRISDTLLAARVDHVEVMLRDFYDNNQGLMRFFASIDIPLPKVFYSIVEFIINSGLRRALVELPLNSTSVEALVEEAGTFGVDLSSDELAYIMQEALERHMEEIEETPRDIELLEQLVAAGELHRKLPFEVDLWRVQNAYVKLRDRRRSSVERVGSRDEDTLLWEEKFRALGEVLNIAVD